MDRRSKIIVSVVGIFIVLLALVGITYAYFLTQVQGNTNDTSISITTANLRLVYNDGSPNIEAQNIQPGDTVYTKTFTVTNEGNASIYYEVYLENVINNFVHEEDLLMFVTCESNITGNTCNGYGNGSVSGNTPTFGTSLYPQTNFLLIQNSIEPASSGVDAEVHTYTLYLKFQDDNSDQSIDMGKELQGKIQIYDPKDVVAISGTVTGYDSSYYLELHSDTKTSEIASDGSYIFYGVGAEEHTIYVKKRNSDGTTSEIGSSIIEVTKGNEPSINSNASNIVINDDSYKATVNVSIPVSKDSITLTGVNIKGSELLPFSEGTLAHKIIDNVQNGTLSGKSTFQENLNAVGMVDNVTTASDKILSTANDDYTETTGKQSYYFRGNPIDNYVEFAEMCWRIVRIEGDGSIKLILASEQECSEENLTEDSGLINWSGSYGYKNIAGRYDIISDYINSVGTEYNLRNAINEWLNRKITKKLQDSYLKDETWCIGDLTYAYSYEETGEIVGNVDEMSLNGDAFYYTARNKHYVTKTPSYICETTGKDGEVDTNKVGTLTFDEVVYAGGGESEEYNYFLLDNAMDYWWWLLSPSEFVTGIDYGGYAYIIGYSGHPISLDIYAEINPAGARPSVTLKSSVAFKSGEGTVESPYIVE